MHAKRTKLMCLPLTLDNRLVANLRRAATLVVNSVLCILASKHDMASCRLGHPERVVVALEYRSLERILRLVTITLLAQAFRARLIGESCLLTAWI